MAFHPGYNTAVYFGATDVSAFTRGHTVEYNTEVLEVTAMQAGTSDPVRSYISGLRSASANVDGMFDPDTYGGDQIYFDQMNSDTANPLTISYGVTVGDRAAVLNLRPEGAPVAAQVSDVVTLSSQGMGTGAQKQGVLLQPKGTESGATNGTSVDNGASTTGGAVANLHVMAFTGTSATINVSDSANDSTFADLIVFSSVTGTGSERATATGTVERYARMEISGTFTSITFAVSFARL